MSDLLDRFRAASASADWIFHRPPSTPAAMLRELADYAEDHDLAWDRYGERGAVAQLEVEVAELLGKPAAVMFPSGVMAQQATLRAWCDRAGSRRVALPDLSHLVHHEQDGPRRVLGLELEWLTSGRRTATADDLAAVGGRLGAAMVELPLRDAGCLLPSWDDLVALSGPLASGVSACTPTARGSGSRCPTGTAAWPTSPHCSTRCTSRSTRGSAARAARSWSARTTSPGSCARGGSAWAARSSR